MSNIKSIVKMQAKFQIENILVKRSTKLCRVCLTENIRKSKYIFDKIDSSCIASMVMLCAQVQIACQDGLPDIICSRCLGDLEAANSFRLRCELADYLLRKSRGGTGQGSAQKPGQSQAPTSLKEEAWINYELDDNINSDSFIRSLACELTDLVSHEKSQSRNKCNFSSKTLANNDTAISNGDFLSTPEISELNILSERQAPTFMKDEAQSDAWIKSELDNNVDSDVYSDPLVEMSEFEYTERMNCKKSPLQKRKEKKDHSKITNHSDKERFSCTECSFKCRYRFQLTSHARKHTLQISLGCDTCGARFNNSHYLRVHKMFCSAKRPFGSNSVFLQDRKTQIANNPHYCSFCCTKFTSLARLNKHKKVHSNLTKFDCLICGKRFKNRQSLKVHKRIHKEANMCELCGKQLSSQQTLQVHINRHMNIRNFHCDVCGRSFAGKGDLSVHVKMHTDPKKFECDFCGHKTRMKRALIGHLMIHTGEKNIKCQVCEYRCYDNPALQKHMLSHSEERKHNCPICKVQFKRNCHINRHMIRIHKIVYKVGDHTDRRVIKE